MKNRQAFAVYRNATAILIALSTTACGGGDSGGGDSPNPAASPETNGGSQVQSPTSQYSADIKNYQIGQITEANAEELVKESVGVLYFIAKKHADYLEELDPVDVSQLEPHPTGSEISMSELSCDEGGSYKVILEQGQMDISPESFAYFGAGDRFTIERIACESSMLRFSSMYHGSATTDVIAGYYDWFDEFSALNSEIRQTFNEFGLISSSSTFTYTHGDVHLKLTDGKQISVQGESLKVLMHGFSSHEYYLGDYQLTLNEVEDLPSYRAAWTMTGSEPFRFGLGAVGQEFEAEILSGVVFDSWLGELQEGSYTLRIEGRTLQVDIFSSHLTYKLDLDQDGVFEIESMLDDSEY